MIQAFRFRTKTSTLISWLLVTKAFLFLLLLPPWQGPDEPTRLEAAVIFSNSPQLPSALTADKERQTAVLQSMQTFEAWRFYERQPPPSDVSSFEHANLPGGNSVLYETNWAYLPFAGSIRALDGKSILGALYAGRVASLMLHLMTLPLVAWVLWQVFAGPAVHQLRWAALLMFGLHPQLSLLAGAVHPDNLGIFLSAALLAWVLLAMRSHRAGRRLAAVSAFVAAVLWAGLSAYIMRKMLVMVPFVIFCVPLLFGSSVRKARILESISRILLICLAVGFVFSMATYERPDWVGWRLLGFPGLLSWRQLMATDLWGWLRFCGVLFSTFWMALGALVSKLALGWITVTLCFLLLAVYGWFRLAKSSLRLRDRVAGTDWPAMAILCLWFFWVGLSTIMAYGPHIEKLPDAYRYNVEGRYLLTALISIVAIWTLGLGALSSGRSRVELLRCWTALLVLLNVVVVFNYVVPLYYLAI